MAKVRTPLRLKKTNGLEARRNPTEASRRRSASEKTARLAKKEVIQILRPKKAVNRAREESLRKKVILPAKSRSLDQKAGAREKAEKKANVHLRAVKEANPAKSRSLLNLEKDAKAPHPDSPNQEA